MFSHAAVFSLQTFFVKHSFFFLLFHWMPSPLCSTPVLSLIEAWWYLSSLWNCLFLLLSFPVSWDFSLGYTLHVCLCDACLHLRLIPPAYDSVIRGAAVSLLGDFSVLREWSTHTFTNISSRLYGRRPALHCLYCLCCHPGAGYITSSI